MQFAMPAISAVLVQQYYNFTSSFSFKQQGFYNNITGATLCLCATALRTALKTMEKGELPLKDKSRSVVNASSTRARGK